MINITEEKALDLIRKLETGPVYFTNGEPIIDEGGAISNPRMVKMAARWSYNIDIGQLYILCFGDDEDYYFRWKQGGST